MYWRKALVDYAKDLFQGEPVALALTGFFAFLAAIVATIWIIDLAKKRKVKKKKK